MTPSIQKLIDIFSKFPTVGKRTANRFVFYLINLPKEKVEELTAAIQELKNKIKNCAFCFSPFENNNPDNVLCEICNNSARNKDLLCVVEKEADLMSIEKTNKFKGFYFILGGTANTLKRDDVEKLRLDELSKRIKNPLAFGVAADFKEVIIATNPTPEGRATAMLVEKAIKEARLERTLKITHLGLGLPVGAELEYADEETLENAFEGRK